MHPGDLAGGFSDLEMTWLLYCAGAATGNPHSLNCYEGTVVEFHKKLLTGCVYVTN